MLAPVREGRVQIELQDILALVVGYGMAALLFRAFWPVRPPWSALGLPGAGLYVWLGMAMSGPIIMLRRRLLRGPPAVGRTGADGVWQHSTRGLSATDEIGNRDRSAAGSRTTWAERAWILIGAYWIVLGIFVIPVRLHEFRLGDVVLFGLAPVVAAVGLRVLGPANASGAEIVRGWTHAAAIALLVTWPFAWICLIILGKSMR